MTVQPRFVDQKVRFSLVRAALPPPPARLCELGVGNGQFLHLLHAEGYDMQGCDVSLKDFPADSLLKNQVRQSSGARLPFPDDHFDAAYSCDVLEHVQPAERGAFLAELVRVTKPGGVVALTAFYRNTLSFRLFGAGMLTRRGALPDWYLEHLTIPAPDENLTRDFLAGCLQDFRMERYQRSLNLLVMWLQIMFMSRPFLSSMIDALGAAVPALDVIGRPTSTFFTGRKRG